MKKVSEYLPVIQAHSRYMLADRDQNGKRIFVYKGGNSMHFIMSVITTPLIVSLFIATTT